MPRTLSKTHGWHADWSLALAKGQSLWQALEIQIRQAERVRNMQHHHSPSWCKLHQGIG